MINTTLNVSSKSLSKALENRLTNTDRSFSWQSPRGHHISSTMWTTEP